MIKKLGRSVQTFVWKAKFF